MGRRVQKQTGREGGMNPLFDAALCRSTLIHHTLQFYAKCEQRSFCSAQNPASFGVKLAYGVVFAGNPSKEKARNFSVHQEVSGFVSLKLELVRARPLHLAGARPLGRLKAPLGLSLLRKRGIYCSIGFIVGTGQGRLTNGFIFLYKPIHAASFFLLPYVTLRNSPQLTGNLV